MLRRSLIRHPDSASAAVTAIEVEIARPHPGSLVLSYLVTGTIGDLRLPAVTKPTRTDELWRRTCFEVFVLPSPDPSYYEFNLSPSTQWAAYGFAGYRSGMRVANEIAQPRIDVSCGGERYVLSALLNLDPLVQGDAAWRLGLSAVIEDEDGMISYWALAHPKGRADFHHSDCFALELGRA